MAAARGTRWEVIARLTLSCALLWLACGELPQGDRALRHKGRETQALQAPALVRWDRTAAATDAGCSSPPP